MTTIIGLAHDGKVYLGGDSQITSGWEIDSLAQPKARVSGLFVLGSSGTLRFTNITQHAFDIPTDTEDRYDMRYMVRVFVPALRDCLKDAGAMGKSDDKDDSENVILVGVRGMLYKVCTTFDVVQSAAAFMTIGSGSSYALGAMAVLNTPPHERITQALEVAARYDAGTSAPFTIVEV